MFGAVGLLLVIGLLNVASLLLTRALSRDREIAVRVAMGATPRQLVTQLLAESLVLSAGGALVGVLAAALALPLLLQLSPLDIPRIDEARVDYRALGMAAGVVVVSTLFFGLLPALVMLKKQLTTDLKSGERGSSRGARRLYSVLVAGEVALACALLVSSALLVRTVAEMVDTPTGVNADHVLTTTVQLAEGNYAWRTVADTHATILESIRQQPGVRSAGASNFLPLEVGWRNPIGLDGEPPPARPEDAPQVQMHSVSEDYFNTMAAEVLAGREFSPFDGAASSPVLIVNDSFVRRYLPTGPAVGRFVLTWATGIGPLGLNLMRVPSPPPAPGVPHTPLPGTRYEIVGVVRDVRNVPLGQAIEPAIYFSTRQFPFREVTLAVNATDTTAAVNAVRNALRQVAPNVPMAPAQTWGERFAARTAEPRLLMSILVFFGGLAGLLAALGVYGLFSWSVALRTRELAIRLTLGAKPADVGGLVMRQSAMLITIGLAAGLVLIRLAEGALARVLYGVTPSDAVSTVTASVVLVVAALVACIPPAVRAMRVDPVVGLRAE
jgi:predicted permease